MRRLQSLAQTVAPQRLGKKVSHNFTLALDRQLASELQVTVFPLC
jgi:hypothetical protein